MNLFNFSLRSPRNAQDITINPSARSLDFDRFENACQNCGNILPQNAVASPQSADPRHQVMVRPASQPLATPASAPRSCPGCGTSVSRSSSPVVRIDRSISDSYRGLNRPKQLVDPVSKLVPVEITAMIFELCVPHPLRPSSTHAPYLSVEYSPLNLGAVCKAWRKVAWATPRLWTFIPINLDGKAFYSEIQNELPAGCEMAKDWLKRTGSALPLDIFVTKQAYTGSDGRLEEPHCTRVMNLVNTYSSRWQHLDLYLPDSLLSKIKPGPVGSFSMPMLETLRVHTTDDLQSNPASYRMRMNDMSPKEINIKGISYESMNIMWTSLTVVVAADLYTDEAVKMITNVPRLTFCALLDVRQRDNHRPQPSTAPYIHRKLSTLILTSAVVGPSDVLNYITLPALGHLELKSTVETDARFSPRVIGLLHRSSPPLHTLILCLPNVSLPSIVMALYRLPLITKLILHRRFEPDLWTQFFRRIGCPCPHMAGNVFLPKLEHLAFAHPKGYEPNVLGWDIILNTLYAALSTPVGNFWKVTKPSRSLGMWFYDPDVVEGDEDRPIPGKMCMAGRHIIGLANAIQAGIPFNIGLKPNLNADRLDIIQLQNTLNITDPNHVYDVVWV